MQIKGRGARRLKFTINPAVDISTSVPVVQPAHKLRCEEVRRDPGGGGINVARVAMRLGADVLAAFTVGGPIGDHLKDLVKQEGIRSLTIPIRNDTREDFAVVETETGQQYRFVLPGPVPTETDGAPVSNVSPLSMPGRASWSQVGACRRACRTISTRASSRRCALAT